MTGRIWDLGGKAVGDGFSEGKVRVTFMHRANVRVRVRFKIRSIVVLTQISVGIGGVAGSHGRDLRVGGHT